MLGNAHHLRMEFESRLGGAWEVSARRGGICVCCI